MRIDSFVFLLFRRYLSAVLVLYKSSGLAAAATEYSKSFVTEIRGSEIHEHFPVLHISTNHSHIILLKFRVTGQ